MQRRGRKVPSAVARRRMYSSSARGQKRHGPMQSTARGWTTVARDVPRLLSHPLFLALITALVIPYLTKGWQDHQRELDIKAGLVKQMTEAPARMLGAIRVYQVRDGGASQLDVPFLSWETNSTIIAGQLSTYFPSTAIPAQWDHFSQTVNQFYATSPCPAKSDRTGFDHRRLRLRAIYQYLGGRTRRVAAGSMPVIDLQTLVDHCELPLREGSPYQKAVFSLGQMILERNTHLTRLVIDSPIKAYSGWTDFLG
jgi:hypothetical protein